MKNSFKKVLALALSVFMVGALAACGGNNDSTSKGGSDGDGNGGNASSDIKIGVICSAAGQNDSGYNQSAVEGAKEIAETLGAEYKVIEPANGIPAALETMADDGYNLIFSLEYDFDALINGVGGADAIAAQYPDTWFVIFNDNPNVDDSGNTLHDNVISVMFNVHEASYLAGYLSVHMNENQDVLFGDDYDLNPLDSGRAMGFVGGTNSNGILVYSYGFIEGIQAAAAEYGTDYDYYAKYDAGFTDPALGSTVTGTMYDSGVNVVFADCGTVGDGITAKAKEAGRLSLQVDANLDGQQPGHVATSILKITGVPVKTITQAMADGKIAEMDKLQNYDLASGATGITDLATMREYVEDTAKWDEIKDLVEEKAGGIRDGSIKVVNAQLGEELDLSTCPNVNVQ